jgi:hypothetical protein
VLDRWSNCYFAKILPRNKTISEKENYAELAAPVLGAANAWKKEK